MDWKSFEFINDIKGISDTERPVLPSSSSSFSSSSITHQPHDDDDTNGTAPRPKICSNFSSDDNTKSKDTTGIMDLQSIQRSLPSSNELYEELVSKYPKILPKVQELRSQLKVVVSYRRFIIPVNGTDWDSIPSRIKYLHELLGHDELIKVLHTIKNSPISGRKLDYFLFRQNEMENKYKIVSTGKFSSRLATERDDGAEEFDLRKSIHKLSNELTRGQIDIFARGQLYTYHNYVFSTAQLNLYHWMRMYSVIEYIAQNYSNDKRLISRKRRDMEEQ